MTRSLQERAIDRRVRTRVEERLPAGPAVTAPRDAAAMRSSAERRAEAAHRVVAALALVALSPLLLLLAVLVRVTSRGPVFYRGPRVGRDRKVFTIHKFRTMHVGAESQIGARLFTPHDRVLTCIGSVLRRTKLDELPQLWNIVRGEMSFVGPRPVRPVFLEHFERVVPGYAERFTVLPGLTGLAQLRGTYYTSPRDKLRYDRLHILNRSLWLDLRLVLGTVFAYGLKCCMAPFQYLGRRLRAGGIPRRCPDWAPRDYAAYDGVLRAHLSPAAYRFFSLFSNGRRIDQVVRWFQRHRESTPGAMLDVGGGAFLLAFTVEQMLPWRILALDREAGYRPLYEELVRRGHLTRTEFRVGDVTATDIAAGSLRCILAHDVLYEPSLDLFALLPAFGRWLGPDGLLCFDVLDERARSLWRPIARQQGHRRYAMAEVRRQLAAQGLRVIEEAPYFGSRHPVRFLRRALWLACGVANAHYVLARKTGSAAGAAGGAER